MNPRVRIVSLCLAAAWLLAGCDALQLGVETPSPTPRPAQPTTAATAVLPSASPAAPTQPPAAATSAATVLVTGTLAPATATSGANVLATGTSAPATSVPATAAGVGLTGQPTTPNPTVVPGQPQVVEAVLILTPGNNSSVASPVRVSGDADPTFEQNLVIEITDASGAVIAKQSTTIQGIGAVRGPFDAQVPFNVSTAGPGRISVYSTSPRDGGLVHLASEEVMLSTEAVAKPVAGQTHTETHVILEPAPQASISGGHLHVSGFSDYVFESQLALVLCGEGGSGAPDPVCGTADNVLATGTAMLNAPDVGQPGPFAGDLTYQVSTTVHARLAVYSRSARDGGIVHLSSVPVQLAP